MSSLRRILSPCACRVVGARGLCPTFRKGAAALLARTLLTSRRTHPVFRKASERESYTVAQGDQALASD